MKILKTPYAYLLLVYLPIIIVGICLALFLPQMVVIAFHAFNWLFLFAVLVLAFSRHGKHSINLKPKNSWYYFLTLLFCLQIFLGFIFFWLLHGCLITLPIPADLIGNNLGDTIRTTTQLITFNSGFFPWPIYLLFGITFAYFEAKKQSTSAIKESLRFTLKNQTDSYIGTGADMLMKQGLFFSCTVTLGISILQFSQIIFRLLGLQLDTGLHFATLLLGMLIFFLLASRFWRRITHYLWHKRCSLKLFLPLIVIFLLLLIVIFSVFIHIIAYFAPTFYLPSPRFSFNMPQLWFSYWQLFVMLWWLGWTPLIGYFLAKIAQGRTIREIILTGLILPIIGGLIAWGTTHYNTSNDLLLISQLLQLWPINILLTFTSFALLIIFFEDRALTYLFTTTGSGKNIKQRIALSTVRSFLLLIATVLIIYLLVGIPFMTLLSTSIVGAAFAAVIIACLGYLRVLLAR